MYVDFIERPPGPEMVVIVHNHVTIMYVGTVIMIQLFFEKSFIQYYTERVVY